LYRRMQDIVTEECAWSFRYRRVNFNLIQPWLLGYRYNDMGQKYFKYCQVEDEGRKQQIRRLNKPTVWPVWVFVFFSAALVGMTLVAARRRTKRW
jgi:hypothetical protein